MNKVIEIIENLKNLSGNLQLDYLKSVKDEPNLKEVLLYTYDSNRQYKIKEDKFNKCLNGKAYSVTKRDLVWQDFKNILDTLDSLKGVKNDDVVDVYKFIMSLNKKSEQELCQGILFKDLKIGLGVSSINKIWDNLIIDYPYLGASGLNDKNKSKIKYPCLAQNKEDGLFCNAVIEYMTNKCEYISRQGKNLSIGSILNNELLRLSSNFEYDKIVFTGEIRTLASEDVFNYLLSKTKDSKFIKNLKNEQSLNKKYLKREISNGFINDEKRPEELNKYIKYIVWDYIPWNRFVEKEFNKKCVDRFEDLTKILIDIKLYSFITVPEYKICTSFEEIMNYFEEVRNNNEEGLVVKNLDSIWKDTKSLAFKIKAKEDCDLEIIGFTEGKGALENACGAVYCKSSDNKLFVNVKPRTPDICKYVWDNQEEFLNKILCVEYNEKVIGQDKQIFTLQHPRWIEIREDKIVADNLENIK